MNTQLRPTASRKTESSSPVIDLITQSQAPVLDWPRLLLTMGAGVIGLLALVCLARFLVVSLIQVQVESQLDYLAHWIGLRSVNQLTWLTTFVLAALAVKPFIKKVFYIATGGMSRLHRGDWLLILGGPALSMAMPMVLQTIIPVREVDPASEAWFHIDRIDPQRSPGSPAADPLGRLGYVREADGTLRFYNIPEITRPSDGAPILRVTRAVQEEWQRQQAEKARREQRQRAAEEDDRREREALRQAHEQRMAELRAQAARSEAERQAALKAEAEAARIRAEAEKEKARLQAMTAERDRRTAVERLESSQRAQDFHQVLFEQGAVHNQPFTDTQPLLWNHRMSVPGDCVPKEFWTNGPALVWEDGGVPFHIGPGCGAFFQGHLPCHVEPLHPGTTKVSIRFHPP